MERTIVVTRHPALVEYLIEIGLADEYTPVLEHAARNDLLGQHVIGVLPLHLVVLARSVVYVPLDIPPELRGQELTLEQVRQYAGAPAEFAVHSESHGVLDRAAAIREMRQACPLYTGCNEIDCANLMLDMWAAEHGLVPADDFRPAPYQMQGKDAQDVAKALIAIGNIPLPPRTSLRSVHCDGRGPVITLHTEIGRSTSTRSFRWAS